MTGRKASFLAKTGNSWLPEVPLPGLGRPPQPKLGLPFMDLVHLESPPALPGGGQRRPATDHWRPAAWILSLSEISLSASLPT